MAEVLSIREEGKVMIIDLLAELDRLSVYSMKNQVTGLMKKRQKFIINFSNINHINSTIVGALVNLRDGVKNSGGNLVLCGVNPNIQQTFDLIGASQILSIYDTEADALEGL
jgi:anti-anti-sigma factor